MPSVERPVRRHGTGYGEPPLAKQAQDRLPAVPVRGRPSTGRVQKERGMLRLDDELFDRINAAAKKTAQPRADAIRQALAEFCDRAGC